MGLFSFLSDIRNLKEYVKDKEGNYFYWFGGDDFGKQNQDYLKLSLENPILFAVISLRCKLYSQMRITAHSNDGTEIENHPVLQLLKNPNFFQSQQDFFFQESWYRSTSGTNLIYGIRPSLNDLPRAMYNLFPSEVDYKKVLDLTEFAPPKQGEALRR